MTIWESMNTGLSELLISFAMLIMLYAGYLYMAFHSLGRKEKNTVISLILFVIYFAAFYMMLDGKFHYVEPDYYYYMDVDYIRTWPKVTTAFCSLPTTLILTIEIITAVYMIWATWYRTRLRRESLTRSSVKEAIDMLPTGVAFAEMNGSVVFDNVSMNTIFQNRFDKNITDITDFDQSEVYFDGKKTWQFTKKNITSGGKPYLQLVANDISEEARINKELKDKNRKLKEIRNRLEIYNRRAEQITISHELLNARRQVHSETGHILLASRHYLEHPESMDEENFLSVLKLTNNHLLKEYEEDDTESDQLSEAIELAKAIAVDVKLNGMIPEAGELRDIMASAVNECATNTKKHADGDTLIVTTEEKDDEITFILTGNGESVEKDIRETGGLASLRTLVENSGGTMEIKAEDAFTVTIKMKNGSQE